MTVDYESMEHLLPDPRDGIAPLTLNRPARRNALHPAMRDELAQSIARIDRERPA